MIEITKSLKELDKNDVEQLGFLAYSVERAMFQEIAANKIRVDCGFYVVALASFLFYKDCMLKYGGNIKGIPEIVNGFMQGFATGDEENDQSEPDDSSEE